MKNRIFVLTVLVLLLMACHSRPVQSSDGVEASNEKTPEHKRHTVTFVAAGDNLFHQSVITSFYANGVYDFSPIYSEVKDIIQNADLAFINQETVMAGTRFGYSGFPLFNSPQALGRILAETGFDIFNLANNHAMDMGASGLYATLDFLNTIEGITVIGARKEGDSARIITKNNISLGFLAYTFSLNGIPLPKDNPNLVSTINRERMTKEIAELRPLCDFLIVSMHWGAEYLLQPDSSQTDLAKFLAEQNVDLIIGHHPHVLQRVDTLDRPDGGKTICYYSLGNFVSHQRERERLIGGMAVVVFSKNEIGMDGETVLYDEPAIIDFGMIPVITYYDDTFRNTKIYPLYSYTSEINEMHGFKRRFDENMTMDFYYGVTNRLRTKIIMHNPFVN